MKRHVRRILIDTLGYLLLILAIAILPLPGPGGLPLALTALGLLSIENAWARRLKDYLLRSGNKAMVKLFPDRAHIQIIYDILVLALVTMMLVWLYDDYEPHVLGITISVLFGCITIFLINRNRGQKLDRFVKHKLLGR